MGSTWGNTEVHIGYRLSDSGAIAVQTEVTPEPVISIGDSVYAGGDVKVPDQGEFVPYTQTLVQGNGTVKINGRYTDITMHGSIMGAGNSCNTGGQTDIYLDYFMMSSEERNSDGCLVYNLTADVVPEFWLNQAALTLPATDSSYNLRDFCTFVRLDEDEKIMYYTDMSDNLREFYYGV